MDLHGFGARHAFVATLAAPAMGRQSRTFAVFDEVQFLVGGFAGFLFGLFAEGFVFLAELFVFAAQAEDFIDKFFLVVLHEGKFCVHGKTVTESKKKYKSKAGERWNKFFSRKLQPGNETLLITGGPP